MKDKIKDYIGRHARIDERYALYASLDDAFQSHRIIIGDDGIFNFSKEDKPVIFHHGDPIIVLQKKPKTTPTLVHESDNDIFYVMTPSGITWLARKEFKFEDEL